MKRINIYAEIDGEYRHEYQGWFDADKAEEISSTKSSSGAYTNGKILLATSNNKLIINDWNNSSYDGYKLAENEEEIALILAAGSNENYSKELEEILNKYEL